MSDSHCAEQGAGSQLSARLKKHTKEISEVLKDFCKVRELSRAKCSGKHSKFRGRKETG